MDSLFYNIVSIVIGVLLIVFSIFTIKNKKKVLFGVITIVHSLFFIFFGIWGFFLPETHSVITILGMLALCISMAIFILTLYKKEPANK